MTSATRTLALSAFLTLAPSLARGQQYPAQPAPLPPGYGGYGWSWGWSWGWGPAGSTVPGDVLGNAGRYLGGLGSYERRRPGPRRSAARSSGAGRVRVAVL